MSDFKKKYIVRVWIPVDEETGGNEPLSLEDAEAELKHLALMQPENRYEIEEVWEE